MTLREYDLRDPGVMVGRVLETQRPNDGDAYLALVNEPSRAQPVAYVSPVAATEWASLSEYERSDLLRRRVDEMPIDRTRWRHPTAAVVTVIARRGLAVFGADERDWLIAWQYSNHGAPVFDAGVVLVTEHGWVDFISTRGAGEPRLPQR